MGRNAHVLRLALGRNADRAPDWFLLHDRFAPVEHDSEGAPSVYQAVGPRQVPGSGQCFNEKGQPIDQIARNLDRARCTAQNAVVCIAVPDGGSRNEALPQERKHEVMNGADWISMRQMILAIDDTALTGLVCFRDRLSILKPLNHGSSLFDSLAIEIGSQGFIETVTAGYLFSILDTFAIDGPLWESIDQLFVPSHPDSRFSEMLRKLFRICVLATMHFCQTISIVAAYLQCLRIGQHSSRKSLVPWMGPLWSWDRNNVLPGLFYVIIPAWVLGTLRLQIRAFAQRLMNQEFCHPFFFGYHARTEWVSWGGEREAIVSKNQYESEPTRHIPVIPDTTRQFSLRLAFRKSTSAVRVATSRLLLSLGLGEKARLAAMTELKKYYVEDLSRLPRSLTYSAIADSCQQIILFPLTGIFSRSVAWLFLGSKSPLRIQDAFISPDDLYPIFPTLADFSPGVGLHATLRYSGKIALTFALQTGMSLILVAFKSAIANAILHRKIKRLLPQESSAGINSTDVD